MSSHKNKPDSTAVAVVGNEVSPHDSVSSMFAIVERIALDPAVSIERVEQAFALYKRVQDEANKKAFNISFARAQKQMGPVKKNADNPQTRSKYATHEALDSAIRPYYTEEGFAITYDVSESPLPEHVRVIGSLIHESGFEKTYHVDMPADGKGAKGGDVMTKTHAMGSAMTYGRRYILGNMWNIAVHSRKDDDGNAAATLSPFISADQVKQLTVLIDKSGTKLSSFLALGEIEKLEDIRADQFDLAKGLLEKKLADKITAAGSK